MGDYATADAIRDELRASGTDPDTVRPRGWEEGKGKGKSQVQTLLRCAKPEQKVWVGGLNEEVTKSQLEEVFGAIATIKAIEKFGRASACVVYEKPEDASNAIALLNGSALGSATLECDVWSRSS